MTLDCLNRIISCSLISNTCNNYAKLIRIPPNRKNYYFETLYGKLHLNPVNQNYSIIKSSKKHNFLIKDATYIDTISTVYEFNNVDFQNYTNITSLIDVIPNKNQHLLEIGTGSSILTHLLAKSVGKTGHVTSLESDTALFEKLRIKRKKYFIKSDDKLTNTEMNCEKNIQDRIDYMNVDLEDFTHQDSYNHVI
ncbi:hypothetical protein A3Q56_05146 [Intoshia linei]|uniref:Uncharacterized protein n=1 Tax=Intoshia linei TaxID=1819745 RepID=A0A177AZ32_9BILA|nr:hypothetical protein A3Q56_05146 [Intoshia linei]